MRKIDLITGFLGSGKTTFLLKYAKYLMNKGLKIGILEYDYGAVNVDMMLLGELRGDNCELEMVAAGCDKDCLMRRFKTKLIAMAMSGYDRVIVEPSGIFDMDEFFDCLREEPLDRFYEIGSVITIVSAKLEDNLSSEADYLLASQAASAGKIVFSRTQLANDTQLLAVKEHIQAAAEKIKCNCSFENRYIEKDWDSLTADELNELSECGYRINDYIKLTAGREHDSFDSVCVLKQPNTLTELKKKIEVLFADSEYGDIFRVKGFAFEAGKCFQINATESEMNISEIKDGQNVVIVIGENLDKDKISGYLMK